MSDNEMHPYAAGTSLAAFFDAASTDPGQWLRDWETEVEYRLPDPAKFGVQVQLDGDFNIAAGIAAVMARAWNEGYSHLFDSEIKDRSVSLEDNPYRTIAKETNSHG